MFSAWLKNQFYSSILEMPFYRPFSFFVFIILMSMATYFFLENEDSIARQLIFFALYAFIGLFFLFKSLYYFRHGATFNEIFFVVGLPLMPPIFAALGDITQVNDLYFSNLLSVDVVLNETTYEFGLAFATILSLPYFFFSIYLLLRTFIRYEFLRWNAHSTGGPPGTFIGLILALGIGVVYLVVGIILADVLLGIFGFIYALNGILGFLA